LTPDTNGSRAGVRSARRPGRHAYAVRDGTAVVEMVDACGLVRMPPGQLAPLKASSAGLGEVVRAALDASCARVVVGIGGSASTDGGAGMLHALGARFHDADGVDLPLGGGALPRLDRVDLSRLHPGLDWAEVVLATDVDNPLLGPRGAPAVYGPQKGATLRTSRFSTPRSHDCPRCSERRPALGPAAMPPPTSRAPDRRAVSDSPPSPSSAPGPPRHRAAARTDRLPRQAARHGPRDHG